MEAADITLEPLEGVVRFVREILGSYPRTSMKVRKGGGDPTFINALVNGEVAPIPDLPALAPEPEGSTQSRRSASPATTPAHAPFPSLEGCSATGCNDHSQTLCGPPSMTRRAGGVTASGTLKADTQ